MQRSGTQLGPLPLTKSRGRHAAITIELIVQRVYFQWLEAGKPRPTFFELIIPPVRVPSNIARNVWKALRGHPFVEHVRRFGERFLARAAKTGIACDEDTNDAASSCDLYHHASADTLASEISPLIVKPMLFCQNHQNQHCILLVLLVIFGMKTLSPAYTLASFMRMGSYMLRLMLAARTFLLIPDKMKLVDTQTDADKLYANEMIDYVVSNKFGELKSHDQYRNRLTQLFSVWVGGYSIDTLLVRARSLEEAATMFHYLLGETMLSSCSRHPSVTKWHQVGESCDWLVMATMSDFFPGLFRFSLDRSGACVTLLFNSFLRTNKKHEQQQEPTRKAKK